MSRSALRRALRARPLAWWQSRSSRSGRGRRVHSRVSDSARIPSAPRSAWSSAAMSTSAMNWPSAWMTLGSVAQSSACQWPRGARRASGSKRSATSAMRRNSAGSVGSACQGRVAAKGWRLGMSGLGTGRPSGQRCDQLAASGASAGSSASRVVAPGLPRRSSRVRHSRRARQCTAALRSALAQPCCQMVCATDSRLARSVASSMALATSTPWRQFRP